MQQQLWGYKVEEKIYLGVRERKRLNITALDEPEIFQIHIIPSLMESFNLNMSYYVLRRTGIAQLV
jgi:hypothetical protein